MGLFGRNRKAKRTTQPETVTEPAVLFSNRTPQGYVRGRHFTEYKDDVENLKRAGVHRDVLDLCLELIEAAEAESLVDHCSPPPWWFDQAALAARRLKQPDLSRDLMLRYLAHRRQLNPDYVAKFERALAKQIK